MKFRKLTEAISRRFKRVKPHTPTSETGNSATGRETRHTDASHFTNLTPPDPNPYKKVPVKDGVL